MNKQIFILPFLALVLLASPSAHAKGSVSDRFLEERVTEEVAEEGLSMARLGLRIVVQQLKSGGARVEIVETSAGRIVMTRSLARLAKEPEAMIAELTIVASALLREHTAGPKGQPNVLGALRGDALASAFGVAASNSSWAVAMNPKDILARHRPTSIHVIAMPSAGLDAEAREAAGELAIAYRVGGVATVQGPASATSSDAMEVVKRFASSSASELALVNLRRYEGSLRAVVTIYNKQGDVITALSLTSDVPLQTTKEDGVSLPTDAISTIGAIKSDQKAAMKEYLKERIVLTSVMVASNGYVGNVRLAQKGLLGGPLSGAAFYRAVEREDYARRYDQVQSKVARGYWWGGAGMLGFVGFGTWAMVAGIMDANRSISDVENGTGHSDWQTPTVLTVLSTGVMVGGFWYARSQDDPHAVNEEGRIKLAEAYNESLRTRLGLSVEDTGSIEETIHRYNLQLAPYANEQGGGVGLGGSF